MELEEVLAALAEVTRQTLQADATAVRLLDEAGVRLTVAGATGLAGPLPAAEPLLLERSPLDREALLGQPIIMADARDDPRAAELPEGFCSVACVPLIHEGDPLGTLHAYRTAPGCFDEEDAGLLLPLATLGAAAIASSRSLAALAALEATKAKFVNVTTHELRSPITVAQSLVRGVLKGYAGELTDKQSEVFGRISGRLDFLESLVNDLLDLAVGKAPELAEEERPVLLNASVGRAVLVFQPRAEERELEMVLEPCRDRLIVWGTEEGLDRVFVNLVSNAVKYTPAGGRITVTVRQVGERAQVEVTDTGIGIPEEALPQLFEEFYRAPNAKELELVGTGLGLTIVRDLVERYGGRVGVESAVGQGSTFIVTLPLYRLSD